MKATPREARIYLFFGILLIALPSILSLYQGQSGKFLVATGMLNGGYFEKTVIYVERHTLWGAHGIVINQPLRDNDYKPNMPLEKEEGGRLRLMRGGPVVADKGSWLILRGDPPVLIPYNSLSPLEDIPEISPDERLFYGYAGWAMLQLNREITRGKWGVIDYDPALISGEIPSEEIWPIAIERVLQKAPADIGGV
ncbi:MAG: YqgE/AlgH family protein [Planctomycetaceae bacterium]|nr:YqgE/AlgH family protein [Planctomycetaceae bacterium]MCB1563581.1 YqgE/AlgH family protein [Alphaproteobacteria bacterium]